MFPPRTATQWDLIQMNNEPNEQGYYPLIHDKMNLNEILTALERHDSGDLPLTEPTVDLLVNFLLRKVDGYKEERDRLEKDVERLEGYARQHFEAAQKVKKEIERLDSRLVWAMDRNKFEKLPGEQWRVYLETGEPLETVCEPTPEVAQKFPDFVRVTQKTSYAWDKNTIKRAIKSGIEFPYGKLGRTAKPKFEVNRKDK